MIRSARFIMIVANSVGLILIYLAKGFVLMYIGTALCWSLASCIAEVIPLVVFTHLVKDVPTGMGTLMALYVYHCAPLRRRWTRLC